MYVTTNVFIFFSVAFHFEQSNITIVSFKCNCKNFNMRQITLVSQNCDGKIKIIQWYVKIRTIKLVIVRNYNNQIFNTQKLQLSNMHHL